MTNTLHQAYVRDTVETVSPARLVVMLYERCCRDLRVAADALDAGDLPTAHENLVHAQEIVAELHAGLDLGAWEHAAALGDLYHWVMGLLVDANVRKDRRPVDEALAVMEPLRDTWREAAAALVTGTDGGIDTRA